MKRFRRQFLHLLIISALFFYPYFKFVAYHDYPVLRAEVIGPALLWIAFVAALSFLAEKPVMIALIYAVLVFLFLATGAETVKPAGLWLRGVICFAVFLFFRKAPKRCLPVMGIFVLGVVASDFALALRPGSHENRLPEAAARRKADIPPHPAASRPLRHVLYLILDEHIGIDGLPPDVDESEAMKKKLTEFYLSNRFTLFPGAYSSYFYSDNSIANILNGTYSDVQDFYFPGARGDERNLKKNRLFDLYHSRGYAVNVYQANYINYCAWGAPVRKCYEYRKNSIKAVEGLPYSTAEKMWVIGSLFLETNSFFQEMEKRMKDFNIVKTKTGGLKVVPDLFDELKKDIKAAEGDTLFFAHLLMPHYPYVYDSQCGIRPVKEWENRNEFNEPDKKNTMEGYQRKYRLYYRQIDCLNRHLAGFFDFLKSENLYDSATIVLHGDHGSRINLFHDPAWDDYASMTRQDMITSHSALLAVKKEGQKSGEAADEMGDITRRINELLFGEKGYGDEREHFVFLERKHGKKGMVRVEMPAF